MEVSRMHTAVGSRPQRRWSTNRSVSSDAGSSARSATLASPSLAARCWRGFVLALVICPVFFSMAWLIRRVIVDDAARYSAWARSQWGVSLEMGHVRFPSPYTIAGDQLTIRAAEPTRFLGTFQQWRCRRKDQQIKIQCEEATLNLRELPMWSQLLCDQLLAHDDEAVTGQKIQCQADRLRLLDSDGSETLFQARLLIDPSDADHTAWLTAMTDPDGDQKAVAIECSVHDDRLQVDIRAGACPLPCSFLKSGRSWESLLLTASLWRGDAWVDRSSDQVQTEFVAEVEPIDLRPLSHLLWSSDEAKITGQAKAYLVQAQYQNGKLNALDLILTARHGTATGAALAAAAEMLQLEVTDAVTNTAQWQSHPFRFDDFRLRLTLADGQLTVRANPHLAAGNTTNVVSDGDQPLLRLESGWVQLPVPDAILALF